MVVTTALLVLGIGHRSGRVGAAGLRRADRDARHRPARLGRRSRPALATVSLITAVFGMYWDIALHIDVGRDEGPLANPAHYFILAGLFGIFAAGLLRDGAAEGDARPDRDPHRPRTGTRRSAAC